MIQNKFLLDLYKKLCQLFEGDRPDNSTESNLKKLEDKTVILKKYSDVVAEQIGINRKLIECLEDQISLISKSDTFSRLQIQSKILILKREIIDLEIEYYSKMDFIGQYENRIKFYEEYHKEYTKQVNSDIESTAKKLEACIQHIPETSKQKTLALGMLHQYHANTKTQEERITMYRKMIDLYNNVKIFTPK